MGGKGSGPKVQTKTRQSALMTMGQLLPGALEVLNMTLNGSNTDRLRYEAAKDCYEFNCGKAKQHVDLDAKVTERPNPIDMMLLFEISQKIKELEGRPHEELIEGSFVEEETEQEVVV